MYRYFRHDFYVLKHESSSGVSRSTSLVPLRTSFFDNYIAMDCFICFSPARRRVCWSKCCFSVLSRVEMVHERYSKWLLKATACTSLSPFFIVYVSFLMLSYILRISPHYPACIRPIEFANLNGVLGMLDLGIISNESVTRLVWVAHSIPRPIFMVFRCHYALGDKQAQAGVTMIWLNVRGTSGHNDDWECPWYIFLISKLVKKIG